MENPECIVKDLDRTYRLQDMYRRDCFEAAYPIHAGTYKIGGENTTWTDISVGTECLLFRLYTSYFFVSTIVSNYMHIVYMIAYIYIYIYFFKMIGRISRGHVRGSNEAA